MISMISRRIGRPSALSVRSASKLQYLGAIASLNATARRPVFSQDARVRLVRCKCATNAAFATEKDRTVSLTDPAEQEAQRFLELGTLALEVGDLEKAMVCPGT